MNALIASKFLLQHPQVKLSKCCKSHNIRLRILCLPKIKISKPKANIMFLIKSKICH